MIRFLLNEKEVSTALPPGTLLLDYIRYHRHLTGTKIGCREGDCGACTVLMGEIAGDRLQYRSMTSCLVPLGNAHGRHVVTVEGVNLPAGELNPVQQAMKDEGASQCGFCTPGFVVSLAGFCLSDREPTGSSAIAAMDGNICRCTGYKSIERAARQVAKILGERNGEEPALFAAKKKLLPGYFRQVKTRLKTMLNGELLPSNGIDALVGGGTDLYVQRPEELFHAGIRFVFDRPGWKEIRREGNRITLGPSVTVTDLMESPVIREFFPAFARYAKLVSSTPIRNMATLAGNFINASPIGDFTIFFLALNAQLVLSDGNFTRELPLRDLYLDYKRLDKKEEEHIEQIWFEWPGKNTIFHFEKVSKRTHLDIASVNSAICLSMQGDRMEKASLSAGGVGPVPMFLKKTSAFLSGKILDAELIEESIGILEEEISPISDARGTAEYKKLLLGQLIRAHFMELFPEAGWH